MDPRPKDQNNHRSSFSFHFLRIFQTGEGCINIGVLLPIFPPPITGELGAFPPAEVEDRGIPARNQEMCPERERGEMLFVDVR